MKKLSELQIGEKGILSSVEEKDSYIFTGPCLSGKSQALVITEKVTQILNNQNIYDGVYDLPRFTETPCSVAENMARVLKSTNSMRMRPTFRWTSIQLIIENTKDTYVDCGFSPVEIFFIVVGALLGFVLLCSLIFNVGCRRRGACGGDSDASFGSCYGGLDCCSMLTSVFLLDGWGLKHGR